MACLCLHCAKFFYFQYVFNIPFHTNVQTSLLLLLKDPDTPEKQYTTITTKKTPGTTRECRLACSDNISQESRLSLYKPLCRRVLNDLQTGALKGGCTPALQTHKLDLNVANECIDLNALSGTKVKMWMWGVKEPACFAFITVPGPLSHPLSPLVKQCTLLYLVAHCCTVSWG